MENGKITQARKSTNKELVEELEKRNEDNRYDRLIDNAKSNRYHDFKNPEDVVCGKVELMQDLSQFPELVDVKNRVIAGEYDEEMDEEDKAEMRKTLPAALWPSLGL